MRASGLPASLARVQPAGGYRDACFFAVTPDRAAAACVSELGEGLRRTCRLKGELFAAERFHVTLQEGVLPGAPAQELIARMSAAGDMIAAGGFALGFDHAASFVRRAGMPAFVLLWSDRLLGLERLFDALGDAMAAKGLPAARSFTPHLTLLYDTAVVPPVDVGPIGWMARDFVLIRSLQGLSHYQFLRRWPLRPIPRR